MKRKKRDHPASDVSVAPSPRCIVGQACDVHCAMSVVMDHMVLVARDVHSK
jgi:hypothetical protein